MSDKLPQQSSSNDEVDLGQLFKLIGKGFERFFNFIGTIFKNIFLAFVWLVFFIKKHIIIFIITGVIGIALGVVLEKTSDPIYKSYITVKQNYNTGESLYNTITYYNDLVKQNDDLTLAKVLGIKLEEVASIINFEIESVISENDKIRNYDNYIKTLDSAVASTIMYKDFLLNDKDYNHQYQQISIKAKKRNNFNIVFNKIIESVKFNSYYKREQQKDLKELLHKKQTLENALLESKTLQDTYKEVLTKIVDDNTKFETTLKIKAFEDENKTKEYELYKNDLEIRSQLVEVEREINDKSYIIEVISSKQDSGSVDNKKEILGRSVGSKIYHTLILLILVSLVLFSLEFFKFIKKYKDKVE